MTFNSRLVTYFLTQLPQAIAVLVDDKAAVGKFGDFSVAAAPAASAPASAKAAAPAPAPTTAPAAAAPTPAKPAINCTCV